MFENTKNNNLPVGWQQASIENISERIHYGYTASAENRNTGIKLLRITDIQNRDVNWHEVPFCEISAQELAKYELKEGDLVFTRTGATVGKSYLIKNKIPKAVFASYLIRIILHSEIDKLFVYYFFQSPSYWQQIGMQALGIGQPNVNATTLSKLSIPLPPLAEQHRIVAKIEELFSDLEDGIASLKKAQAQLKTYRQAVLKYAFEGKLTAAWRQQHQPEPAEKLLAQIKAERERQNAGNGKTKKSKELPPLTEAELGELPQLPEGWRWVRSGDISNVVRGASPRPAGDSRYFGGSIPWITVGELTKDERIYLTEVSDYVTEAGKERSRFIEAGTLLLTNSGATLGVPKITKIGGCINDGSVAFFELREEFKIYLYYFLKRQTSLLRAINQGAAQPNLNTEIVKNIKIPFPSLFEQHQIVQEIESRLSVCDKLEESLKDSLQKAEALRQSILKKAFEGKLVPQDPNDEPAEKLSARIQAEKAKAECKL